jgi:hypothetical protein
VTTTISPPSNTPRADSEEPSDTIWRETKHAEGLAELVGGYGARVLAPTRGARRSFRWLDHVKGHRIAADGIRHQEGRRTRAFRVVCSV